MNHKNPYRPKWLERSLLTGAYLTLVTSQLEYENALKHLKLAYGGEPFVRPGWQACTHTFHNTHGSLACIVGLDMEDARGRNPIDVAALLVHEAVHVWQAVEESAGRLGCFGTEGEAYCIQNISTQLMGAYAERL